jgi:cytochrome c553
MTLQLLWRWAAGALTAILFSAACAQDVCEVCHGQGGNSITPRIPSIAGQPKLFIETQLVLMREELRPAPVMQPLVQNMKDAEITRFADHFSKLTPKSTETGPADPKLIERGKERAAALRCGVCHVSDFKGQNQIPRLAAQRSDYLAAEMRAYRDNKRKGGDTIMAATLYGVPDADIDALAHFLSRLR